jgi:4-hydroxy-tetrahydrodipicolinate synthase
LRVKDLGADYGLVITPYYNKPTQEGLYRHFSYVADQVKFPILIYNVPSRTGVNIQPETVERLAKNSNIVGIKEASGNLVQVSEIIKRCGEKFIVLSGEDGLTLPLLSLGATGVISVTANVVPRETHEMITAYLQGETHQALQIHLKLLELAQILFVETSPGPVKAALQMIGFEVGAPRLPLAEVTDGTRQKIRKVISDLGYLKN